MQLTFTADEFRLLLELLLERERLATLNHRTSDHIAPLAQKFVVHDLALALDELEDLEEFLKDEKFKLEREIGRAEPGALREEMFRRRKLLDDALNRVTEACAMA